MKRLICFVLGLVLSISLIGCSSTGAPSAGSDNAPASGSEQGAAPAPDKVYTFKLAYTPGNLPAADSPDIMFAEVFKEYVEEHSAGAIKVELYPSGQLGSAAESVQGVVAGNIEMSIIDVTLLNNLFEESQLLSCPGMFGSVEECDAILSGPWGEAFRDKVQDKTGIRILSMHSKGFRNFTTSNKELKTVGDAKGVTFRVMESPVSIKMVEALGAKAVPMPGSEMYVAMQNGVVDGQENPILNIIQDKTYEVQKYLVLDGHIAGIMGYIINGKLYDELPDSLRQVIEDGAATAMPEAQKVVETKNSEGVQILRDYGMIVYEPTEEELSDWHQSVFEPTQAYLRETLGDGPMDELVSAIESYRAS